jgi:hypothetical protein
MGVLAITNAFLLRQQFQHRIPWAATFARRQMGHTKKRSQFRRNDKEKQLQQTSSPGNPSSQSLFEAMGWQPLIFIGLAPLAVLGVLCVFRPSLREQLFGSIGWETENKRNYVPGQK